MKTIGDRIKAKRKELNLTQLELAVKLNVTDRAVSKWEQNEGNPDLNIIPTLCDILGVTTDYLLLGKEEEVISMDDMDAAKRAELLAKKDDVDNFVKYGCQDKGILFGESSRNTLFSSRSYDHKKIENLRKIIVSNRSYKIFSLLLDDFVSIIKSSQNKMHERNHAFQAWYVKEYLDDFVFMTAMLGRIDVLDLIGFKWFSVGGTVGNDSFETVYGIKTETLDSILGSNKIPDEVIDYILNIDFLLVKQKEEMYGQRTPVPFTNHQIDYLVNFYYTKKDLKTVERLMGLLYKNLKENTSNYVNYDVSRDIRDGYRDAKKSYTAGLCSATKSSNGYRYPQYFAYVPMISAALENAKKLLDISMIASFNEYNKEVVKTLSVDIKTLSDEDINFYKIKADPNSNKSVLTTSEFTRKGLLNFKSAIDTIKRTNEVSSLKNAIKEIKEMYDSVIEDSFICYPELILWYIQKKDFKSLFKFASDNKLEDLADMIVDNNSEKINEFVKTKFLLSEDEIKAYEENINKINDLRKRIQNSNGWNYDSSSRQRMDELIKQNDLIAKKLNRKTEECLKVLLERQAEILNYEEMKALSTTDDIVKKCKELKKDYVDRLIRNLEESIEEITKEKARKAEYDKVTKEITFDYLRTESKKGNLDNAIIKLCVLLEGIFKFKFNYEGDLFDMIDKYMKNFLQLHEMINPWDDEDNNYYSDLETDRINAEDNKRIEQEKSLLHKLRMKRNSLVHAESNDVSFTSDDLEKCIKIVEKL